MSQPNERGSANNHQVGGEHYRQIPGEQLWDRIWRLYGHGYFVGNIIKYTERYKNKNGIQDLEKARHYLDKLIELETTSKKHLEQPSSSLLTTGVPNPCEQPTPCCGEVSIKDVRVSDSTSSITYQCIHNVPFTEPCDKCLAQSTEFYELFNKGIGGCTGDNNGPPRISETGSQDRSEPK